MEKIEIFTDGGARGNPGPAAIGVLMKAETGQVLVKISRKIGVTTNNVAEYRAVIEALEWLKNNSSKDQINKIDIYSDSKLIVNQLNGLFRVKDGNLQELLFKIKQLEQDLKTSVFYNLIPREQNSVADELVNQALDQN